MHMGPEMEKHIITRSTIMCIPADFPHGPWRVLNVTRPFLIITINQNGTHTEKALKNMVPEDMWDRMIFMTQGYEGEEDKFEWPEKAGPPDEYM
jgi:hypothetical protein